MNIIRAVRAAEGDHSDRSPLTLTLLLINTNAAFKAHDHGREGSLDLEQIDCR